MDRSKVLNLIAGGCSTFRALRLACNANHREAITALNDVLNQLIQSGEVRMTPDRRVYPAPTRTVIENVGADDPALDDLAVAIQSGRADYIRRDPKTRTSTWKVNCPDGAYVVEYYGVERRVISARVVRAVPI